MSFLTNLTKDAILHGDFPLQNILQDSLYYPSCGFDGGVVKDCNMRRRDLGIRSFVYCDFATGENALIQNKDTFFGYHIFASREVLKSELTPHGWNLRLPLHISMERYTEFQHEWKPFINWTVYERDNDRGADHGPEKFSVLYLGGEGVATYHALYWSNKATAKVLAIIQPGTGYGLNWTDFNDENGALAWVVNNNPFGTPEFVYYGGYGRDHTFSWQNFQEKRIIHNYYSPYVGEVRFLKKIDRLK